MYYVVARTEKLTKIYGHQRGVENITLDVEPGEVYGLLGPRRSGKSTLVRLLLDLVRPTSGRVLLFGQDLARGARQIRSRVGYLPAEFNLYPHMTGWDALRFFSGRATMDWRPANHLAQQVGLDLSARLGQLSAAHQRKIALVQAFMHSPDLVILDEPTLGLDSETCQVLFRWIAETRADGRSVLFTTSDVCEAERACDRVAVLNQGELLAVERAVRLRTRALHKVEVRFAAPIQAEAFAHMPNLMDVHVEDRTLRCTLMGDPERLAQAAGPYLVTEFSSWRPSLEETYQVYYGMNACAC